MVLVIFTTVLLFEYLVCATQTLNTEFKEVFMIQFIVVTHTSRIKTRRKLP